ncbi:FadR/GntR family transcriptional regulator [Azospirillum canadense]|uniref:FadR/GntR family transcriptional regulator n=1 Tax=Azospirillum canadense TaxID=403962 RepID=UPI0022264E02|nr:FCD domain-containing protein [Azospirillum canadense]MCW2236850.1 DNA-binding FadR family transcriptional regulator [Azospirillum canadense]
MSKLPMANLTSVSGVKPPDTLGRAQIAYDHLQRAIASGLWRPGEQLPTERRLAESLGLARNTVRRALDMLEAEGRIARGVGRGTFLVELDGASALNGSALLLPAAFMNASPAEVMEARILLEPAIADLAVARATLADFAEMERCLRESEGARSIPEFEHWDGALHRAVIAACRNELLDAFYAVLNRIRDNAEWNVLKQRSLTPERRILYEKQHRAIVAALKARDPAAAREVIRAHLIAVRDALFTL